MRKTNRLVQLNQPLNCKNYGIYVANCVNCNAQYVGQTKINFRLDGITIDILGKNLIFRSKSILPLPATL